MDKDTRCYQAIKHIRYEIPADSEMKVFIIPEDDSGVPNMRKVLCLSDITLEIWDMIVSGKDVDKIVDHLFEKYNEERVKILNDVHQFLFNLSNENYIQELRIEVADSL